MVGLSAPFLLPALIDRDHVTAEMHHGVLTLRLPKRTRPSPSASPFGRRRGRAHCPVSGYAPVKHREASSSAAIARVDDNDVVSQLPRDLNGV